MLVSLIVPTYNRCEYLAEALESCLNQTWKELEIIVVDDGSTDDTVELMEYYLAHYPQVRFLQKENGGTASALNYGCKAAQGSILCFGAADDIQLPNKVEDSAEAIKGADFAYTGYYHCNDKAEPWEYCKPLAMKRDNLTRCASGGSFVMTKETWEKIPYREELRINEDLGMLIDVYKSKLRVKYLNKPTYHYRMLSDGVSYGRKKEVDALTEKLLGELDET